MRGRQGVVKKKDFEVDSLADLSGLLNKDEKTVINFRSEKDKLNMAMGLSIWAVPMLSAVCVTSMGLPVAEFLWLDAVGFLGLIAVDALFIALFDHIEALFMMTWWLFFIAVFVSYPHKSGQEQEDKKMEDKKKNEEIKVEELEKVSGGQAVETNDQNDTKDGLVLGDIQDAEFWRPKRPII